ncbi:MAG TPA: acetyl/propionyl/methylcrotonyl-CoA carboxylase subunit alpha [Burkholderiales bacterium]|nr:acetyl/propionyl/methylcrotonyl-CoA carboxylase subunit alpha [Burkholderiales bacterium]
MFAKILIANRGEIACRVMRTAARMGIRSVAVYSDVDRDALHVKLADEARRVESYLDIGSILAAARESRAEAIHPGYGFLSESEEFAAACERAGIVFIGPAAEAIAAMGDKASAKRLMEKAGVPLVPGYHGTAQDVATLAKEVARIGFPALIKPVAGGGGKGMRVVKDKPSFSSELEASRREAKSAFGDERVLIERYLERPRHIEVQVFGDTRGNIVHLFERDCSVQRRHQKVLEEAPAPGMTVKRRDEMGAAAVAAARAIGYTGAGTVEFIVEPGKHFYFMEMNTRLQVEHPVTEMITGLDLVEWQLRVAAGEPLPLAQQQLRFEGHAIEARIYAEDPQRDFLPATGKLLHLAFPAGTADVRIDSGVEPGTEIGPWYDPMIAKLIVRGADRAAALARLRQALAEVEIAGLATNVEFLRRLVESRAFSAADLDTGLIERSRAELFAPSGPVPDEILAAAAFAELAEERGAARRHAEGSGDPYSPWHAVDGWRLNQDSHHDFVFAEGDAEHAVRVSFIGSGHRLSIRGRDCAAEAGALGDGRLLVRLDGRAFKARTVRAGRDWHVFCEGAYRRLALKEALAGVDLDAGGGSLAAPMPGRVIKLMVGAGTKVTKGQPLLILEAMKMEHTITAPADGVVKEIHYAAGEQVLEAAVLITLE